LPSPYASLFLPRMSPTRSFSFAFFSCSFPTFPLSWAEAHHGGKNTSVCPIFSCPFWMLIGVASKKRSRFFFFFAFDFSVLGWAISFDLQWPPPSCFCSSIETLHPLNPSFITITFFRFHLDLLCSPFSIFRVRTFFRKFSLISKFPGVFFFPRLFLRCLPFLMKGFSFPPSEGGRPFLWHPTGGKNARQISCLSPLPTLTLLTAIICVFSLLFP